MVGREEEKEGKKEGMNEFCSKTANPIWVSLQFMLGCQWVLKYESGQPIEFFNGTIRYKNSKS